jgi:hypothetical protein
MRDFLDACLLDFSARPESTVVSLSFFSKASLNVSVSIGSFLQNCGVKQAFPIYGRPEASFVNRGDDWAAELRGKLDPSIAIGQPVSSMYIVYLSDFPESFSNRLDWLLVNRPADTSRSRNPAILAFPPRRFENMGR